MQIDEIILCTFKKKKNAVLNVGILYVLCQNHNFCVDLFIRSILEKRVIYLVMKHRFVLIDEHRYLSQTKKGKFLISALRFGRQDVR